jgi:hypothetical protein
MLKIFKFTKLVLTLFIVGTAIAQEFTHRNSPSKSNTNTPRTPKLDLNRPEMISVFEIDPKIAMMGPDEQFSPRTPHSAKSYTSGGDSEEANENESSREITVIKSPNNQHELTYEQATMVYANTLRINKEERKAKIRKIAKHLIIWPVTAAAIGLLGYAVYHYGMATTTTANNTN